MADDAKKFSCCSISYYVTVLIAAMALGGGLAYHFSTAVFNSKMMIMSTRYMIDTKSTLDGFSTLMCDNLHVNAPTFQAYRLEGPVKPAPDKYNVNVTLNTDDSLPDIQSYYLPVGSDIMVTMCIERAVGDDKSVDSLVFKGYEAYNVWRKDNSASGGAYRRSTISTACNGSSIFQIKPSVADNYYLVIYNWPSISETVNYRVKYDVSFEQYDLSAAKLMCDYNIHSCDVPLDLNTDQNIVLRFGNDSSSTIVRSSCTLRASMWVVMFGVLPGILALLFTVPCLVIKCLFKIHDRRERQEMKRNGAI